MMFAPEQQSNRDPNLVLFRLTVNLFVSSFLQKIRYFPSSLEVQAFGIHDDRLTATVIVNAGNAGSRNLFGKLNSRSGKVHSLSFQIPKCLSGILVLAADMWLGFFDSLSGMLLLVFILAAGWLLPGCL
ncbi:hypothetical protein WN943_013614 [Citrus x changshan-huyou]